MTEKINLSNKMEAMSDELTLYAQKHGLEIACAYEMLMDLNEDAPNYEEHRSYLYDFIRRWDELEARGHLEHKGAQEVTAPGLELTEVGAVDELNNAINFALDGIDEDGYRLTEQDGIDFLRMWREGDWQGVAGAFPTFQSDMLTSSLKSLQDKKSSYQP